MISIQGQRFLTIHAAGGEIYELKHGISAPKLSFANHTDGNILIGTAPEFDDDGNTGQYMTIAAGSGANNISMPFGKAYIKTECSGDIVIVRC